MYKILYINNQSSNINYNLLGVKINHIFVLNCFHNIIIAYKRNKKTFCRMLLYIHMLFITMQFPVCMDTNVIIYKKIT